jgi:PAS domain S-box-containing protein
MKNSSDTKIAVPEILIVEDSPTQAQHLKHLLETSHYQVEVASQGKEALAILEKRKPLLIISDVIMPEMDGFEFCRNVKSDETLKDIPVVLVTSLSGPHDVIRGLQSGADNFIRKPYDEKYILSRVRYILANRELRKTEKSQMGLEIYIEGAKYFVNAERQQILDLLISTYDEAVRLNEELKNSLESLNELREHLEETVKKRTAALTSEIAERKKIAEALRQNEERTRAILETANEAFIVIDSSGIIIDWNRQAEITFGWPRGEILGKFLVETLIPPQYRAAHKKGFSRFFRTGEGPVLNKRLELSALRRDGKEFPIEITIWPLKTGNTYQFNAFVRDITERKKMEEQLRQSQKMEAIGNLAGGVAHDFNNLLTVINGYTELMSGSLKSGDPFFEAVEEIQKAGQRAASLTSQLLSFSRRQVVQPRIISVNDLILDMDKMIRRLLTESIEVITIPKPDIFPVKVDPGLFQQVLMNLVVNARDAMPGGGKLVIETKNIFIDEKYITEHVGVAPGDYVMIAVTDNGCGMTEEVKSRIFEPFFTTKSVGKGTGLGLATSYGIVEQAGGHIRVYSEPGHGTTFKIYLPRAVEAVIPLQKQKTESLPRGSETVLLVEDEPLVRNLAAQVLRAQGYEVLEASNGQEALETAKSRSDNPIHLLVTDLIMPRMGGKELGQKFKELFPRVKMLFTSGYAADAVIQQGILKDDIAFIQKPFSPRELAVKVRHALDRIENGG